MPTIARRPAFTMTRPLGLALAFSAALVACGGGGGTDSPTQGPLAENASALAASKPGELLEAIKTTLKARQAQGFSAAAPPPTLLLADQAGILVSTTSGQELARSTTTVQEAGVDEDDLLKSDGDLIYSLDTAKRSPTNVQQVALQVHRRAADGKLALVKTLAMPVDASTYPNTRGMLLASAAKRAAVLGESTTPIGDPSPCPVGAACIAGAAVDSLIYWPQALKREVNVQAVELADGGAALGTRLTMSGQLVASRLVGNTLFVVTSHQPALAPDLLPSSASQAERDAALAKLTAADALPTLRINDGPAQPLVADTDCYVQPKNASLAVQITTITAIDLGATALPRASRCFAGGTEAAYMSPSSLYLATTRYAATTTGADSTSRIAYPTEISTDIHKFALSGLRVDYRGSGAAKGHLGWDPERTPYRMSEYNGDLRVLTFTGQTGWALPADASTPGAPAPSPATLTVLRERASDATLQAVATLPNAQRPAPLGHAGEQVYGVRMLADRGYLVTFRQTDPLYVLDLSNPADPRQLGELQVPGFSDHLYPMDGGLLLGVGRDADANGRVGGIKVALFDVRDAGKPALLSAQTFGDRGAQTALDGSAHGINLMQRGNLVRVALPAWVADAKGTGVHSLQRYEVDTQSRTLSPRKALVPTADSLYPDLGRDRSLQIEGQVYWLSQGRLSGWDW